MPPLKRLRYGQGISFAPLTRLCRRKIDYLDETLLEIRRARQADSAGQSNFIRHPSHRLRSMNIRFSRFRTFVFTFALGLVVAGYFEEVCVSLPEVQSHSPIIIRVCPKIEGKRGDDGSWNLYSEKGYQENGNLYFSKERAMNCRVGGGGG